MLAPISCKDHLPIDTTLSHQLQTSSWTNTSTTAVWTPQGIGFSAAQGTHPSITLSQSRFQTPKRLWNNLPPHNLCEINIIFISLTCPSWLKWKSDSMSLSCLYFKVTQSFVRCQTTKACNFLLFLVTQLSKVSWCSGSCAQTLLLAYI